MTKKELYWSQKTAGRCVKGACPRPAGDDSLMCDEHWAKHKVYYARSMAKPAVVKHQRELARWWREKRIQRGLCANCGRLAVTDTLCVRCRDRKTELRRLREPQVREMTCRLCQGPGHTSQACPNPPRDEVSLEALMASGTSNLGEAQR
jgi:hypothetical protein